MKNTIINTTKIDTLKDLQSATRLTEGFTLALTMEHAHAFVAQVYSVLFGGVVFQVEQVTWPKCLVLTGSDDHEVFPGRTDFIAYPTGTDAESEKEFTRKKSMASTMGDVVAYAMIIATRGTLTPGFGIDPKFRKDVESLLACRFYRQVIQSGHRDQYRTKVLESFGIFEVDAYRYERFDGPVWWGTEKYFTKRGAELIASLIGLPLVEPNRCEMF
jgi:hypothetical protein